MFATEIRAIARQIAQAKRTAAAAQGQSQGFRYGTVQSTGLGSVQVLVDGSDEPTPCSAAAVVTAAGHRVAVRIDANGHGEVLRDYTDPAASASSVEEAKGAADQAARTAAATGQHFWTADDGVHVTQAEREVFEDEATGPNLLANSLGFLLRVAANNLASLTASAVAFYDGGGNSSSNVVAQFGSSGAQVGKETAPHITIGSSAIQFFKDAATLFARIELAVLGSFTGSQMILAEKGGKISSRVMGGVDEANNAAWTALAASVKEDTANPSASRIDLVSVKDGQRTIDLQSGSIRLTGGLVTDPDLIRIASNTTAAYALNAGAGRYIDVTLTIPSGYTLIGVLDVNQNHNVACSIGAFYKYSNNVIRVYVTNRSQSNFTDVIVTVNALCVYSGIA